MSDLSVRIATFALNAAWQSSIIVLLALSADPLLRRAEARVRHAVLVLAIMSAVAVPLATLIPRDVHTEAAAPVRVQFTASSRRAQAPVAIVTHAESHAQPIAAVYLAITLLASLRMVRAAIAVRRLRSSQQVLDLDLESAIPIAGSVAITSPVTIGPISPLILVPASRAIERELLEPAIAHEVAHVERRDPLLQMLIELFTIPIAFNPLLIVLKRHIAEAREMACDERVARNMSDPAQYARALVAVARALTIPHGALALGGSPIEKRIRFLRFVAAGAPGRGRSSFAALIVTLAIATSALTLSRCRLSPFGNPDLSGHWRLNRAQTNFGRVRPYDTITISIDQRGGSISTSQRRVQNGTVSIVSWTVKTNGRKQAVTINGIPGIGTARWTGGRLILELAHRNHWEHAAARLDNGGKTLICDGIIREPKGRTQYRFVFDRL